MSCCPQNHRKIPPLYDVWHTQCKIQKIEDHHKFCQLGIFGMNMDMDKFEGNLHFQYDILYFWYVLATIIRDQSIEVCADSTHGMQLP